MYTALALKWPQILPAFGKDAKEKNEPENKDKSATELMKLDWKAKKALRDQPWKETLSDALDAVLKDTKNALQKMESDISERVKKLEEYDKRLDSIDSKLESLFSIIADHEEFFSTLSQGTLENMLFNEDVPIFRRLKAFLRLLAMDIDGRVKEKGFELILQNKRTIKNKDNTETKIDPWLDVLETMPKPDLKIVNKKRFEAVLDEINANIYSGMMR